MATTAPRRLRIVSRPAAGLSLTGMPGVAIGLGALLALSAAARATAIGAGYWIDEGLTVGLSSFGLLEIPSLLRQDGSPPLYYILLHLWMGVAGDGEIATHMLSLIFALLSVVAALWAGWSLMGPASGWACAVLTAFNPYLTNYAQETRMYSLLALLSILTTATFLQVFVFGRRRYLLPFAGALTLMLYTHNWALYVMAAAGAGLLVCALALPGERRRLVRDALPGFGLPLLLYLPWVPTLLYQVRHTGAPWSEEPTLPWILDGILRVLGHDGPVVALILAGGAGAVALWGRGWRERLVLVVPVLIGAVTIALAWAMAQVAPAWSYRYLAVLIGPLLIPFGLALGRAGRLGVAGLAIIAFLWGTTSAPEVKSNVRFISKQVAPLLEPGDLVVSTHPEQIPVLSHYLEPGLRYGSTLGPVTETRVMDWRDVLPKLQAARPAEGLEPMLADLPVGRRVMIVRPVITGGDGWTAPWTHLVRKRSAEWARALKDDKRFRKIAVAPTTPAAPGRRRGVRAVIYRKVRSLRPR